MLRCPLVHLEDIQAYIGPSQLSSIRWAIHGEAYTRRMGKKHEFVDKDGGAPPDPNLYARLQVQRRSALSFDHPKLPLTLRIPNSGSIVAPNKTLNAR